MENTVYVLEVKSNGVHGYAGIYSTNEQAVEAEKMYREHFEVGKNGVDTAIRPEKLNTFGDFGKYLAARFGTKEII